MFRALTFAAALAAACPAWAQSTGFAAWLAGFRAEAQAAGIAPATLAAAFDGIEPVMRAVELDRRQPEFVQSHADYLARRVTPRQVARGQALLAEHAGLLAAVSQQSGVPPEVLVAFWGLETNFGATLGSFNIPAALATLAWEGRRAAFFKAQLMDALRIIEAGHVSASGMVGSWAGAMGHMQFMPATFRAYAVDGDGDGRIDLWRSLPDAMHSAGHYLRAMRWRAGEPVAAPVVLPQGFDYRLARLNHRRSVAEWRSLGVAFFDGAATPPDDSLRAAIALPQGWQGPAYFVFDNFDVVMRWNRSVNYALAVSELARQIAGGKPLLLAESARTPMSLVAIQTLQQQLNDLGYEAGEADGLVGPRTQSAIRRFQGFMGLPVDGYPSAELILRVAEAHAARTQSAQPHLGGEPAAPPGAPSP